ncbi:hypothetical protein GEPA3_3585 [Geobacillus sp. PA-3]|nr:hypothetical protein GEPA3_3585 [Geobacillus sp. PA-3]
MRGCRLFQVELGEVRHLSLYRDGRGLMKWDCGFVKVLKLRRESG